MTPEHAIVSVVLEHFPGVQGVYLFGSHGAGEAWPESDVDLALLLSFEEAGECPALMLSPCHGALAEALGRPVDLVNLRLVSTVFQLEIIKTGRLIYTGDINAINEFEMLTLSFYQKLNEERKAILDDFAATGKAYRV